MAVSTGLRVLFVTRKFPPSIGGMEMYSAQLHHALTAEVGVLDLFTPNPPILGRPSIPRLARFIIAAAWQLATKARRYDVILLGDYAIASLAVVAKLATAGKVATAVSLHGNDLYFMRGRSLNARAYAMLSRIVVASGALNAAIANSHAIAREAEVRGLSRVHVIPLATRLPTDLASTPRNPRQLLFAGRLIRYKGLAWFMREVWPRVQANASLLVAGPVWDPAELASIENVPRVVYLGALPPEDIPRLRAESAACIMPNLPPSDGEQDEGFGIAALEGPAVGTPTLASRCGGLVDAIEDGVTGFLLPPLDADAWAAKIDAVLSWSDGYRRDFGHKAKAHVEKHYNWQLVARRTAAVLHAIAGHG